MKATASDISFAEMTADLLRKGIVRVPNDLYFSCKAKEAEGCAALYDAAAAHMRETGEWSMPNNDDLTEATKAAWAVLEGA